jgi:hypothetical protein
MSDLILFSGLIVLWSLLVARRHYGKGKVPDWATHYVQLNELNNIERIKEVKTYYGRNNKA